MNCNDVLYFWSGIMRDHAEFQLMSLSFRETQAISKARYFKDAFITLRRRTEKMICPPTEQECDKLIAQVIPLLNKFIDFKKYLIKRLMDCDIELSLTPTFISHMVNEALEFKTDLLELKEKPLLDATKENIKLHMIWLPDAAGHAAGIIAETDYVEAKWIEKAMKFQKKFTDLFVKTSELSLLLERAEKRNGALELLNEEVFENIEKFILYLEEVKELREKCKLLGSLSTIVPDHMIREEKYYLAKIESLEQKKC
jgi:hypothetical protein